MATMNISIPDEMKAFVEEQAAKSGFGTVSEYMRVLIRGVQERQADANVWTPCCWLGSTRDQRLCSLRPIGNQFGRKFTSGTPHARNGPMARKTPRIVRHPQAILDIVEVADFTASRTTLMLPIASSPLPRRPSNLSRMPGLGTRWESDHPRLADLRFFPVTTFPIIWASIGRSRRDSNWSVCSTHARSRGSST